MSGGSVASQAKVVIVLGGLALVLSVAPGPGVLGGQRERSPEPTDPLPPALVRDLREQFPHLAIPKSDELYRPPGEEPTPGASPPFPFACRGDFNGDALQDVALLLRDRAKEKLALMAFHQDRTGGYSPVVVAMLPLPLGEKLYSSISCRKPGTVGEIEGSTHRVRNDSIILYNVEGATELYFFEKTRYRRLITGD